MRKLTFDFVKKYIEENTPYRLISKEYVNSTTKLELNCLKHGVFKMTYNQMQRNHGCAKCGTERMVDANTLSYKHVSNYIEKNTPYELVSKEYVNAHTKLDLECYKHGLFKIKYGNIKSGKGCAKCGGTKKLTHEHAKDYIEKNTPYELVSKEYVNNRTKIELTCPEHGLFKIPYGSIKSGKGCAECSGTKKLTHEHVKNYIEENTSYKLISKEYVNGKTKLDLNCPKHGIFKIIYNSIQGGKGCAKCANEQKESKGEAKCREIFQRLTDKSFINTRPDFLINPSTGYKLELDGYCEELKMAFEYDGEQHFEAIEMFGGQSALTKTKERDTIKDTLCINNNIKLIRIPYNTKDIEKHIKEQIGEQHGK